MSFRDQAWNQRYAPGGMGDIAETQYEQWMNDQQRPYVRFGLNRPDISLAKVPARLRYTPDYITSHGLVEVKGVGRDQRLKIKLENWNCLQFWNSVWDTQLFIWDSHKRRHTIIPLGIIEILVNDSTGGVKLDHFNDSTPKAYFSVLVNRLDTTWIYLDDEVDSLELAA